VVLSCLHPAQTATILNTNFQDAAQIPEFARNKVAAATLNQLVVNYPNVALIKSQSGRNSR
jgi:hypothetical protein